MRLLVLATIALLVALVAGGTVWIVWSIAENIAAKRNARATSGVATDTGAQEEESPSR